MPCSPGMKTCHARCLHRGLVREYHDARDARDALRETEQYMQHEQEEFDQEQPKVLFKNWLIEHGRWYRE